MPRTCTICTHDERGMIDRALVYRKPYRHIAAHFAVSTGALQRHAKEHLPELVAKGREVAELAEADALLMDLKKLQANTLDMLYQARDADELRTALAAVAQARRNIELMLEIEGKLERRGQVNIYLNPEWTALKLVIVEALAEHPDARVAVVRAIQNRQVLKEAELGRGRNGQHS